MRTGFSAAPAQPRMTNARSTLERVATKLAVPDTASAPALVPSGLSVAPAVACWSGSPAGAAPMRSSEPQALSAMCENKTNGAPRAKDPKRCMLRP
jgi:hypothetical protein